MSIPSFFSKPVARSRMRVSSLLGRNASCGDFTQLFPRLAGVALHGGTGNDSQHIFSITYRELKRSIDQSVGIRRGCRQSCCQQHCSADRLQHTAPFCARHFISRCQRGTCTACNLGRFSRCANQSCRSSQGCYGHAGSRCIGKRRDGQCFGHTVRNLQKLPQGIPR